MPCINHYEEDCERQELNKVTKMLCTLCFAIETANAYLPSDIQEWWERHKRLDRERNK